MTRAASASDLDRVLERRRAVALARHYREFEGLSIRQIADRLGRSPATVKAYFYDPSDDNKRLTHSLRANASFGATRAGYGASPRHKVASGLSKAERTPPHAVAAQPCASIPTGARAWVVTLFPFAQVLMTDRVSVI